ncbi:MAG: DUF3106 domain-containing protein [Verrucomicrobia bacterium]|nr:DUF3106 domain-containing protein [Verrucomicrobiota bacterium]MDE3097922.1 DUF3106 domain-containing protein [Verrucomicrobiota bacterium]
MNFRRQRHRQTAAIVTALALTVLSGQAQVATNSLRSRSAPVAIMPPPAAVRSPVDFFRNLLEMPPLQLHEFLAAKPPGIRVRIVAKIREYMALDPNQRELKLRATELRWYLLPLLHEPTASQTNQIARIPADLLPLVRARLEQWDALPSQLRGEFLDNERTLLYFTDVQGSKSNVASVPARPAPAPGDQARWNALSQGARAKITRQFNEFFQLTPDEARQTLQTLSAPERAQMERTLKTFNSLPPAQRLRCIRAFTDFAGMSPRDRAEFLKNAAKWAQMSPSQRQAWRDLVASVPLWPPMPPSLIMPPMPPKLHPMARVTVATNLN